MTDELTSPAAPLAPEKESAGGDQTDYQEGYRAPRWAWLILLGLAATAVAVPALGSDRSVLFQDDFSGSSTLGRWLHAEDATGSMGYESGGYHIAVTDQGELMSISKLPSDQSAIRIEVDAGMVSGAGGLSVVCISDLPEEEIKVVADRGVYYDFFLTFPEHGFAILRSDRLQSPLTSSRGSGGLILEDVNRVDVTCIGAGDGEPATLTLAINGEAVLDTHDGSGADTFKAVGLAVYGEGGAAEAEFDNIKVSRP